MDNYKYQPPQNTNEKWLDIPNFPGYMISDLGRVFSRKHNIIMKANNNTSWGNYPVVSLSIGGVKSTKFVHYLVMLAFIGDRPKGMEICHNDGNRDNCALLNLRYDTVSNNTLDKHKHGTFNVLRKMTAEQVKEIRKLYIKGHKEYGARPLARRFNISYSWLRSIVNREWWRNVE